MSAEGLLDRLLRELLPAGCRLCDRPLARRAPLCVDCSLAIVATAGLACRRCAGVVDEVLDGRETLCLDCGDRPPPQASTTAYGDYRGPLREAVLALKHGGCDLLAPELGSRLAGCLDLDEEPELVTWVPSRPWRRLWRGDSAARLLALEVGRILERPTRSTLCRRDRGRQVERRRAERRRLPAGAFRARRGLELGGRRVLLVDDVRTTGATLERASAALLTAGAGRVDAAVLAITPPGRVTA